MKNAHKSDSYEPTLSDVLEAVQTGFAKVEERFEGIDERLGRHDSLLKTLVEGQGNLQEQLNDNTNRLIKTQNRVEDIVDVLEKVAKSVPSIDVAQLLYENK